jgi:alpha-L-fucosidase
LQDSAALSTYNPSKLDVDQWLRIGQDAGMKYAVLTAKHVDGLSLWPSKHTSYTTANTPVKTDVVGAFVTACRKYGIQPVLYYCAWDNHHRFGSLTPSQTRITEAYTTSFYQDFQTAQITELITQYGKLGGVWINIPQILGRSYRTFLYGHIARHQPDSVIMMNSGIGDGSEYRIQDAWPSDLIAMNRYLPPESGHVRWREIEGKVYYMPGEVVDTLGKEYFFAPGDPPRPDDELKRLYVETRRRGANLLLAVQPNQDGFIPKDRHDALVRLRKNAAIT